MKREMAGDIIITAKSPEPSKYKADKDNKKMIVASIRSR